MKSKSVEGLPAGPLDSVAANEEFREEVDGFAHPTHSHSGWDPYEVWRTRVKNPSTAKEHEPDPRG